MLTAIADPNVALFLLFGGLLAIYIEFNAPGRIVPGAVGGAATMLSLAALWNQPIALPGFMLVLLAILFFILEARYAARGILMLAGAATLVLGLSGLVKPGGSGIRVHLLTALVIALPFAFVSSFLFSVAYKGRRSKRHGANSPGELV